jgi:hypothetical protein
MAVLLGSVEIRVPKLEGPSVAGWGHQIRAIIPAPNCASPAVKKYPSLSS